MTDRAGTFESNKRGQTTRSFTSEKLDWMSGLSSDPRISPRDFEVGFMIAQHINEKSRTAYLSVEAISDKTNISVRCVFRSLIALKEAKWINWKRTRSVNVYALAFDSLNGVLDYRDRKTRERKDRRIERREMQLAMPRMAEPKANELPRVAGSDMSGAAESELPPMADIHLLGTR